MATNNSKTAPFADFFKFFNADAFKASPIDMNSVFSIYRRNIEAISAANQAVTEGFQAIVRRSVEIAKANAEEALSTSREFMSNTSPEAKVAKSTEVTKNLVEKSFDNVREMAELAAKSNVTAYDIVNKRIVQSFDELSNVTKKAA